MESRCLDFVDLTARETKLEWPRVFWRNLLEEISRKGNTLLSSKSGIKNSYVHINKQADWQASEYTSRCIVLVHLR